MDDDKISVISMEYQPSNKNEKGDNEEQIEIRKIDTHKDNETSPWNVCHVFSVLAICIAFLATITLVPRTNSILYQSYWYEFNFCILAFMLLQTATDVFNMATYLKEKSILSFWIMLRIYAVYMVVWSVPYLIAYLVWCQYLNYKWPIPFLGYNYFLFNVVRPASLWISFPRDLRRKKNFKKNFKLYILEIALTITFSFLREGMSFLFNVFPGYLQWIVAFLIPLLKHFESFVLSRLVSRMAGGQEEASQVLLELTVNSAYAFFIAVRLPNAEMMTVGFIITVDFFILLQMTYKIIQSHNMVRDETNENENIEGQRMVTKLAVAELTEGLTPIVYAIGIAMGYFGFNGTILGDVKNDYWGYRPVDDIGYLFQIMILLFGVDFFSTLINSFTLSILTEVALFREFSRIMKRYLHLITIKFVFSMYLMFLTKDINLGMDATGDFNWITNEGRIKLINGSTDLSYEEKLLLLN